MITGKIFEHISFSSNLTFRFISFDADTTLYCLSFNIIFIFLFSVHQCHKSCQLINSDQIELPLVADSNINKSLFLRLT